MWLEYGAHTSAHTAVAGTSGADTEPDTSSTDLTRVCWEGILTDENLHTQG